MAHNGNPNSLKNLERGRWRLGQSGNPSGRPRGVVYPSDLLNGLLVIDDDDTPRYTRDDLQKIVEDENAAPALVIAAQWIIDGMNDGKRWIMGKNGELKPAALDPTPSRVRESLADRLEGKPVQKLQVQHELSPTLDQLQEELMQCFEKTPELLGEPTLWPKILPMFQGDAHLVNRFRSSLVAFAPGLLAVIEPVDGEAKVLPAGDDEPSMTPA